MLNDDLLHCHPIRERVEGAPYQVGDGVLVVAICDEVGLSSGLGPYVGRRGKVEHLEYDCGCGQHFPDDPMVGARMDDGELVEFWREELELVAEEDRRC